MTREEAIAILEVSKHMATSGRMYNQAIDMAIEALHREEAEEKGYCHRIKPKEYLSADAEWIPCSERLPEDGQGVLVTVDANKWNIEVGSCIYSGGTFHSKLYDLDVIAWMPLPTPYTKGESDDRQRFR